MNKPTWDSVGNFFLSSAYKPKVVAKLRAIQGKNPIEMTWYITAI